MSKLKVLVADDNVALNRAITRYLGALGCQVVSAFTVAEAKKQLEAQAVDLLLVDFSFPDGTGAEVVAWALPGRRAQVAYCITGVAITANVVAAIRAGCRDVLEKPFELDRLDPIVEAFARAPESIDAWRPRHAPDIVGQDPELVRVLEMVRDVAQSPSTVLITGESGTGKELFARAIHSASGRKGAFVALNCAALPESLIEAELFGHAKGAFTGAGNARQGHILAANGGTLFLDEIGDMPVAAQARLLRALQERQITPLGCDDPLPVDVRVIAATHKDLEQMVEEGKFRQDLYFRLSVIPMHLSPLRERPGDILELAGRFLKKNARAGAPEPTLTEDAEELLRSHPWPGNVRELGHAIERVSLLTKTGRISAADLRPSLKKGGAKAAVTSAPSPAAAPASAKGEPENLNLREAIDVVEREMIMKALERTGGNRTEAAALLGLNRTTLVEKLRKLE